MDSLAVYLPIDRRFALLHGEVLPDRTHGAALFADISGFTPLTAALAAELGRQRGAEKVLDYINPAYEAIIGDLHCYHGSVIGFAGDSITCWLDGDDGRRAVACALQMQRSMARFATVVTPGGATVTLSIKIAVVAGPARRFLAGNPQIHNFEALAGATLERMADGEHQAQRGEVVVGAEVAEKLGSALEVAEWREEGTARFAVVGGLGAPVEPDPWPALPPGALAAEQLRPWIDGPVYERLLSGASYVAELRPVTALFMRFGGIDYDGDDEAGPKLSAYVQWIQKILSRYDGAMLQLTIGDKGSNLLAVFGAPVAHDDDDARAVAAALELRSAPAELPWALPPQIGVSRGLAWAGACGGRLRCIYSVLGDEVNVAARLMSKAAPGQVLVSGHVAEATARRYRYQDLGRIALKGKDEPVPVLEAMGRQTGSARQLAALFTGPLVGREEVMAELTSYLATAQTGQGQVVRLEGVAGVGKSRLAAALAGLAVERGWRVVLGASQSITQGSVYAAWRQLFFDLLEMPAGLTAAEQIDHVTAALMQVNPEWESRLPLLGPLLGLPIPDNATTASLEPQLRQQVLFALVGEIVQTWAGRQPLLLFLEDVHWLDEASAALTVAVARSIGRAPALLLAVQRPPLTADQAILPALDSLSYYHFVRLGDLAPAGVVALVAGRLQGPPAPLVQALVVAQAQGNPFFSEELVDTLREAGYVERRETGEWGLSEQAFNALLDGQCLVKVEGEWQLVENPPLSAVQLDLPDSVHGTVLARLDRLPEAPKLTLKVASVIGRTFGLGLLRAVHPTHPTADVLQAEIETLGVRDFVRLEVEAADPVYLFKHNITQEVAYDTLLFTQRQGLHAQVGEWYERAYADAPLEELTLQSALAPYYPLLVHHWHNAENTDRERLYAGLAGEQAAGQYANETAVRHLSRALELTPEEDLEGRYRLLLAKEGVNDILGKREAQKEDLTLLEPIVASLNDAQKGAAVSLRRAIYFRETDDYPAALVATGLAVDLAQQGQDQDLEARAYHEWGRVLLKQGKYQVAPDYLNQALILARAASNQLQEARTLYELGLAEYHQANYRAAQLYLQQAQPLYKIVGYRPGEVQCLNMFGALAYQLNNYVAAQECYEQALGISRSIGWQFSEAYLLMSLGNNTFSLGSYPAALAYHQQARSVCQQIGNRRGEAVSLDTLSLVFYVEGDYSLAEEYSRQALVIQEQIGDRRGQGYTLNHLGLALVGLGDLGAAAEAFGQALALRRELGQEALAMDDLASLVRVALAQGNVAGALAYVEEILAWLKVNSPDGIEFPILVYLTCYRVMRVAAENDPAALDRAQQVLQTGYNLLQEQANRIQDEALRKQFLEKVPFNREMVEEWGLIDW